MSTFLLILAFSGSERVKRKPIFWKLLQTALGSIQTCFHWIPTEIRAFGNFHFGSLRFYKRKDYWLLVDVEAFAIQRRKTICKIIQRLSSVNWYKEFWVRAFQGNEVYNFRLFLGRQCRQGTTDFEQVTSVNCGTRNRVTKCIPVTEHVSGFEYCKKKLYKILCIKFSMVII